MLNIMVSIMTRVAGGIVGAADIGTTVCMANGTIKIIVDAGVIGAAWGSSGASYDVKK